MTSARASWLAAVAVVTWSCAGGGRVDVATSEWDDPFATVARVWSAAARGNADQLSALTVGQDVANWVAARSRAYPRFFQQTAGQLRLEGGDLSEEDDTVVVQFRAPFVSCPPPVHTGVDDTYFARLRRQNGDWRVIEIWMNIC